MSHWNFIREIGFKVRKLVLASTSKRVMSTKENGKLIDETVRGIIRQRKELDTAASGKMTYCKTGRLCTQKASVSMSIRDKSVGV